MCRPKFISFDCQGTLIHNPHVEWSTKLFADRLPRDALGTPISHSKSYWRDETMGPWKPFCNGIAYDPAHAQQIYNWKAHPDAPASLARLAREFPFVGSLAFQTVGPGTG